MSARLELATREVRWSLTVLLVAFVFCKAAEVTAIASWSWVWVLAPLWVPAVVAGALLALAGLVGLADQAAPRVAHWRAARRRRRQDDDHLEDGPYTRHPPQLPGLAAAGDLGRRHPLVARLAQEAGVRVTWNLEYLHWRVLDLQADTKRGFAVSPRDVDEEADRALVNDDTALATIIRARLAELRA